MGYQPNAENRPARAKMAARTPGAKAVGIAEKCRRNSAVAALFKTFSNQMLTSQQSLAPVRMMSNRSDRSTPMLEQVTPKAQPDIRVRLERRLGRRYAQQ